jgi:dienelactone hydrolase
MSFAPRVAPAYLGALAGVLLTTGPGRSQKQAEAKPGDKMIGAYLAKETARISQRFLDGAPALAEWEKRRPRLYREYLDMLGLWPLPPKTPLKATVTGTLERDGVVIEKLHYQSRPGLYVTANLYRPKKAKGKLPAVLYVCGHAGRGRDGNKTAYQDHGRWFGSNGYVCLVLDTLQLGEIPGIHHGTYSHGRWWWQARGYTPAGVECWNGIRGIDYLVSRPEVDADRIAVTGISGGGAYTFWIAAADERVKCAVPVSGMSDLKSYVTHKVINGHCDCMFLINTYQWEWTTIAALIAPRPLLFCNSDNDPIFPMDGNRRIIARLRKLYAMYGKPELVDDYVSKGGHAYRPDLRVAIFQWVNRHIKKETGPVKDADFKPIPGKELRVFPGDKDEPKDAINGKVDEVFVPAARVSLPEPSKFASWKAKLMDQLIKQAFRSFPQNIKPAKRGENSGFPHATVFVTEPKIEVWGSPVGNRKGGTGPSLWVTDPKEETSKKDLAVMSQFVTEDGLFLCPRGAGGGHEWTKKSPPNYVERAHALLGHTVDQGRVLDIVATIRHYNAQRSRKQKWKLVGRGQAGILAAYAALFEPTVEEVVVIDPPKSHRDGPIFLNVLRVLDIPEALGLLAPRRLTLINARDKAFDRTAQIYKLAGVEKNLQRK